jgi:hypothetical protein
MASSPALCRVRLVKFVDATAKFNKLFAEALDLGGEALQFIVDAYRPTFVDDAVVGGGRPSRTSSRNGAADHLVGLQRGPASGRLERRIGSALERRPGLAGRLRLGRLRRRGGSGRRR